MWFPSSVCKWAELRSQADFLSVPLNLREADNVSRERAQLNPGRTIRWESFEIMISLRNWDASDQNTLPERLHVERSADASKPVIHLS